LAKYKTTTHQKKSQNLMTIRTPNLLVSLSPQ
jgi:hypothetical protein